MGNIVLLDELTINKIAAGEVIERPASVIKEMVENSIDAGATNITIEIKNGGISFIKITDNGKGIAKDDVEMAFERHATSKIRCAEDLNTVRSMGFRGEALASIAAIANVELVSKTIEQDTGCKVVVEGGYILEKEEVGCSTGTSITVQNLFYNTPVRYKFLKKDYTETGYIEDVVTRIALVHPEISIKLLDSGKTIIQTSGNGDLQGVIYSIYGKDIASDVLEVEYNYEDIKIKGVIGRPQIARSNRSNQLFFVNNRYIKDKILTAATEQAYKDKIVQGKFPFLVLNIIMDPSKVDVNVHPAKLEVRFEEEGKIFQAIFHAIKDSLAKDVAYQDTTTKVDNIIIQSSERTNNTGEVPVTLKSKSSGLFGWRKNKESKKFGNADTNIIEDLYNKKKIDEFSNMDSFSSFENETEQILENAKEDNSSKYDDETINTSDVLKELKQINEDFKKNINNEISKNEKKSLENEELINKVEDNQEIKTETDSKLDIPENNNLPDGKTYTYVGENKEKIEDLLRQLHPETYNAKENDKVAEDSNLYENVNNIESENNENVNNDDEKQELFVPMHFKNDEEIREKNIDNSVIEKNEIIVQEETENEVNNADNVSSQTENIFDKNEKVSESLGDDTKTIEIKSNTDINPVNMTAEESLQAATEKLKRVISEAKELDSINENIESASFEENKKEIRENIFTQASKLKNSEPQIDDTIFDESRSEFNKMYEKMFGTTIKSDPVEEKNDENKFKAVDILNDNVSVFDGIQKYQRPTFKFIGIVFDSYILAEIEKEMYIINQRTSREKIIFEKLKDTYYNKIDKDSQILLLPDIIELTNKEVELVKENYDILEKAGFSLEEFGENTIRLEGVPTVCLDLDTKMLFIEILDGLNTVARTSRKEKEEKFIATISAKIAEKADMVSDVQAVNSLLEELLQLPEPFTYDFDKPIAIKMTKYDIERKFSRK